MFTGLKSIVSRVIDYLTGRSPSDPRDPYARVLVPRKRGPNDRSSAVALAEPDED